jgi:Tfp pilus assembly protein PilN
LRGARLQIILFAGRWSEEDASLDRILRSFRMVTVQERSALAVLEARRANLQRELSLVDKRIHQTVQALTRLEERIKILEPRPRQAA